MSYDLDICPFCGGEAAIASEVPDNSDLLFYAHCKSCYVKTDLFSSVDTLIDSWNQRFEDTAPLYGDVNDVDLVVLAEDHVLAPASPTQKMKMAAICETTHELSILDVERIYTSMIKTIN